jgi:hypothetical protein
MEISFRLRDPLVISSVLGTREFHSQDYFLKNIRLIVFHLMATDVSSSYAWNFIIM